MTRTFPGAIYHLNEDGTYTRVAKGDPLYDAVYCFGENKFKSLEDLKEVLPTVYELAIARIPY